MGWSRIHASSGTTGRPTVVGYTAKDLDTWAGRLKVWADGGQPSDLPRVDKVDAPNQPRDVFAYVIHEGKVRAPAAAMELIKRQL